MLLQEPGSEEGILQFCSLNYGVQFPILKKLEVSGYWANILLSTFAYRWLTPW